MPVWSTACPDWEERILDRKSMIAFSPLYPDQAKIGLDYFDSLFMVDAGKGITFGDICRPWTREFVSHIFGSYDASAGVRRITEYFLLISKKNGKSTTAAGIMLTALLLNWREEAEFIILSPTKEIADNSYKPAAAAIRADEELSAIFQVQDHTRTITHRTTNATLKVVAADSNTVSGKKATGILIDELWLFGMDAKSEAMLMEATGGLASRPEGFIVYLTTQSDQPPAGVFKTKLQYARDVRDGKIIDPSFLPVIYEFPRAMVKRKDYRKQEYFYVTNPNLTDGTGTGSVNIDFMVRNWKQKQEEGEEAFRQFMAKHLNVELGMNLMSDRWPGADHWEAAAEPRRVSSVQDLIDYCEVIAAGIDGGGLDDLLGGSFVGRCKEFEDVLVPAHVDEEGKEHPAQIRRMKRLLAWCYAWAHPSVLSRRQDIVSKLRDFKKAGEMSLVSAIGDDTNELAAMVGKVYKSGLLFKVGIDPAAIGGILDAIVAAGVPEELVVTVNQGWRLAGAIKTTEVKVARGELIHGGTGLMAWCVGNARVKVTGNAIVITKQVSGTAKIDPLMALFNAVQLMALNPPSQIPDYNLDCMVMGG